MTIVIREVISNDLHYVLEGDINNAIEKLTSLKFAHQDNYIKLELEFELDHTYDNSTTLDVTLYGIREESIIEKNKRLSRSKTLKKARDNTDRMTYERLKKKFKD